MSSAKVATFHDDKHEGFFAKYKKALDRVDEKLIKLPDTIHHGWDKFADGTKKTFKHWL